MNFDLTPLCRLCPPSSGCNRRPFFGDPLTRERYYVESSGERPVVRDRRNPEEEAVFMRTETARSVALDLNRGLDPRSIYLWTKIEARRPVPTSALRDFKVGDLVEVVSGATLLPRGGRWTVQEVDGGLLRVDGRLWLKSRFELVTAVENIPKPAPRDLKVGDRVRMERPWNSSDEKGSEWTVSDAWTGFDDIRYVSLEGKVGSRDASRFSLVTAVETPPEVAPAKPRYTVETILRPIYGHGGLFHVLDSERPGKYVAWEFERNATRAAAALNSGRESSSSYTWKTAPEPDSVEKILSDVRAIAARVEKLKSAAPRGNHRALTLVATKLDEARLWLGEVTA